MEERRGRERKKRGRRREIKDGRECLRKRKKGREGLSDEDSRKMERKQEM